MAYLQLLSNPDNNTAFERVINHPPRGIGKTTLAKMQQYANEHKCSLWQAGMTLGGTKVLTKRAVNAIANFCQLITDMQQKVMGLSLEAQVDTVI